MLLWLRRVGLLGFLFPELKSLIDLDQGNKHHKEGDAWTHTILVIKNCPANPLLQISALYHDIGKSVCRSDDGKSVHFYGHEGESEKMVKELLKEMSYSEEFIEKVCRIIKNHMRPLGLQYFSDKIIRKIVRDVGVDLIEPYMQLVEADCKGKSTEEQNSSSKLIEFKNRIHKLLRLIELDHAI
jgi:tRNA nucleotidyltransferase (CCA-adding enzyme)